MDRIVVSAYEARQMLGISPNRLQKILESGEIDAYKVGRNWKIPVEAITEYVRKKSKSESEERKKAWA